MSTEANLMALMLFCTTFYCFSRAYMSLRRSRFEAECLLMGVKRRRG